MVVRKNMGRAKSLLVLLMVLGFSFATYNLIAMIINHKEGLESFDEKMTGSANSNRKFHVALTATDAAYSQWQCRIMYHWYKKVKDMPGSDMGKFTCILHSGRADQLMDEIPTFVADPLPEGLDRVNFFLCPLQNLYLFSPVNFFFMYSRSNVKFTHPDIYNKPTPFTTNREI